MPRDLEEYIIDHKLAHLLAPNGGRIFQRFLLASVPDREERER